eukprot:6143989-Pyramimonas_sp.AAC.1
MPLWCRWGTTQGCGAPPLNSIWAPSTCPSGAGGGVERPRPAPSRFRRRSAEIQNQPSRRMWSRGSLVK